VSVTQLKRICADRRFVLGPLQVLFLELIVLVRLYAIFGGSKLVLRSLLILLVCTTSVSSAIVIMEYNESDALTDLIPGVSTCFAVGRPLSFLWAYWVPIAIFELVACILAVYKTRQYCLDMYACTYPEDAKSRPKASTFLEALMHHSLVYFVCMAILVVTGSLIVRFEPESLMVKQIIAGPIQAILAILGSRLLLSTQDVVLKTFRNQPGDDTDVTHTAIGLNRDIELSDLSDTLNPLEYEQRFGVVTGIQLDTIADTTASHGISEFAGAFEIWTSGHTESRKPLG